MSMYKMKSEMAIYFYVPLPTAFGRKIIIAAFGSFSIFPLGIQSFHFTIRVSRLVLEISKILKLNYISFLYNFLRRVLGVRS